MTKRSLLLGAGLFLALAINAQTPMIEWQKSIGGSSCTFFKSIQPTSDGGTIVCAQICATEGDITGWHIGYDQLGDPTYDIWVAKLDPAGSLEWQKALGGTGHEAAYSVLQTSDGGFLVLGNTWSNDGDVSGNHGYTDLWVVKLTAAGNVLWQRALGGSGGGVEGCSTVGYRTVQPFMALTSDGGCLLAGSTTSNDGDVSGAHGDREFWVVKLDPAGTIVWQRPLGGSNADEPCVLRGTNDDGAILLGYTISSDGDVTGTHGGSDFWVVKVGPSGTMEWQKALGGSGQDRPYDIRQSPDGGYIVGGLTNSSDGDVTGYCAEGDWWMVKLDPAGDIQWQSAIGGPGQEGTFEVLAADDGGYFAAGTTYSHNGCEVFGYHGQPNDGTGDLRVVKLGPTGTIEWQRCLGGYAPELAYSAKLQDDGCVIAGRSASTNGDVLGNHGNSDAWVVKLTSLGAIQWQKSLGGSDHDQTNDLLLEDDGGYIAAGEAYSNDGDVTGTGWAWVVKLSSGIIGIEETLDPGFSISPIPAMSELQIATDRSTKNALIILSDAIGREIKQVHMSGPLLTLNVSDLPRGMYTITRRGAGGSQAQRLVLE
ncbi:MAG: T9SS type A sorting domain-containing protein [Flavobacteriales bacterium]